MPTDTLDIEANRRDVKWTKGELLVRLLWAVVHPSFRLSPRQFWAWRRFLLRLFGARIGRGVHVYPSVRVTIPWTLDVGSQTAIGDRAVLYGLGAICIGERTTISQGAHLCAGTHDHKDPRMPLIKSTIEIGSDVWICADAFIGPGVHVADRAIVGARAVAMRDVPAGTIVAGNPAKKVGTRKIDGNSYG